MPAAAPVTRATLPCSLNASSNLLVMSFPDQ